MFGYNVLSEGVLQIACGDCWTWEDTNAALKISQNHSTNILIIDISKLTIPNGFTVAAQDVLFDYEAVIVVCGSVENRYKVELLLRLNMPRLPVVAVLSGDEAEKVRIGLHSRALPVGLAQ